MFPRDPGEAPPTRAIDRGELVEPVPVEFPRIDGIDLHELAGEGGPGDRLGIFADSLFHSDQPFPLQDLVDRPPLHFDAVTPLESEGNPFCTPIKKADLGIAMFAGAQATRQVASVVLIKNSFSDLPGGVRLADSIIQSIKMCAALFFNQVFLGLLFFIALTVTGHSFPFTSLNFTFTSYFAVGLPGSLIFYWIVRPIHASVAKDNRSFFKQVFPLAFISAIPQALIVAFAFYESMENVGKQGPTSLVLLAIIIVGFIFFMFIPSVFSGPTTRIQKMQLAILAIIEIISLAILIKIPIIENFYNLTNSSLRGIFRDRALYHSLRTRSIRTGRAVFAPQPSSVL